MWIGLLVGAVIGGLAWGLPGGVVLGFVGWLGGLIISSLRGGKKPVSSVVASAAATPAAASPQPALESLPLEARVVRLEAALARVEARLALLGETPETGARPWPGSGQAEVAPSEAAPSPAEPPVTAEAPPTPVPQSEIAPSPEGIAIPEPAHPAAALEAAKPNFIIAWLTGGNTIARVGLVISFFGLAFLLKYAADNRLIPPEVRVGGIAVVGMALLGLGWWMRARRTAYALGLQGAGVAVLYLTTFGAMRLYHLIPPEVAFAMLAAIAVFSAVLAIVQDAVALAVIGAGGGFLAPVLASTGGGSHVALFGYYLVLNTGIAIIAFRKAWRPLNLTGFLFTFIIGLAWGARDYRPEFFGTTEPFLIAFFLIYVLIAVLVSERGPSLARARPGPGPGVRWVDGTLVFGVPLAAFGLQAGLMRDTEYGLAFSSLAMAAFYLGLAWWLIRGKREGGSLLAQSFLALGVVFATLAIPLALDARWTSASWALEGAAIVWIGLRQRRPIARGFGLLLQVAAGVAYVEGYRRLPDGLPLLDAAFLGAVLLALAGLWTHRLLLAARETVSGVEKLLVVPAFAWGLGWLLWAGIDEIQVHVGDQNLVTTTLAFFAVTAVAFGVLANRWTWGPAAWTARAMLPVAFAMALMQLLVEVPPLRGMGWIAWPLALGAHAWIMRSVVPDRRSRYTTFLHAAGMLLFALLGAHELHWIAETYTARGTAWSVASVIVVPAALVLIAASRRVDERWPIVDHALAYRYQAAGIIALGFAAWSLYANFTHDASSDPLPYLPIVNGLDLAHLLVILALANAWLALPRSGLEPPAALTGRGGLAIAGGLAFIWLNGILLRTLSHWADIPYRAAEMTSSRLVQASLSIFWAALALAAMVFATRTSRRALWMLGMSLMVVVVAKLFIVDLREVEGIEAIVAFIAVGIILSVIGYFSPVPPRPAP